MRRCPPAAGGSKWNGRLPSSRLPEIGAGDCRYTQTSVMQVPRTIAPGLTLGAGPSNNTRARPWASLPVTTRRIGFGASAMTAPFVLDARSSLPRHRRRGCCTEEVIDAARDSGETIGDLSNLGPACSMFVAGSGMDAGFSDPADQAHRRPESRHLLPHHRGASATGLGPAGGDRAAAGRRRQARRERGRERGARRPYAPVRHADLHTQRGDEARLLRPGVGVRGGLARSVAELVALAKSKPRELNCGSAGIGTVPHLACETLNKSAGVNVVHVPYRDVNAAMMGTVGGTVQMFVAVSTVARAQLQSGTVRGLAVTTAQRSTLLADLPTMVESGFPDFVMPGW